MAILWENVFLSYCKLPSFKYVANKVLEMFLLILMVSPFLKLTVAWVYAMFLTLEKDPWMIEKTQTFI